MGKFIDITGQRFGRLVVIAYAGKDKNKISKWLCRCDCGNEIIALKTNLKKPNHTTSCGCYKKYICREANIKHDKCKTQLYRVWQGIVKRCYKEKEKQYKYYGGRGIKVCDEWRNDFMAFYNWAMANGYTEEKTSYGENKLSIDRIDVNGNYEPSNCRWATRSEQANNRRTNHLITYEGETYTVANFAKKYQIDYFLLYNRLFRLKWTIEEAINGKRNKP